MGGSTRASISNNNLYFNFFFSLSAQEHGGLKTNKSEGVWDTNVRDGYSTITMWCDLQHNNSCLFGRSESKTGGKESALPERKSQFFLLQKDGGSSSREIDKKQSISHDQKAFRKWGWTVIDNGLADIDQQQTESRRWLWICELMMAECWDAERAECEATSQSRHFRTERA